MVPAFGADEIITGGANTCTVDVLGVYDNNATAKTIATWTPVTYECAPGQYLLETETSVECTPCPIGSYCPGGTYTVESENMGATACPTDYTSDAGSTAESECYIGCELACSKNVECPPHSNNCTHSEFKTTGKQFSGETCNAYPSVCPVADFQCDIGYSKESVSFGDIESTFQSLAAGGSFVISTDVMYYSCNSLGKDETNGQYKDLSGTIIPDNGVNDCEFLQPGQVLANELLFEISFNDYGDTTPGIQTFETRDGFDEVDVTGHYLENANFTLGGTGKYMWLRISKVKAPGIDSVLLSIAMTEFSNTGNISDSTLGMLQSNLPESLWNKTQEFLGQVQSGAFSSEAEIMQNAMKLYYLSGYFVSTDTPWVFGGSETGADMIEQYENMGWPIGIYISNMASSDLINLFNQKNISTIASYCANNTINIDWNPDNGGGHIQNMCIYDGAITLPADPVRPGYTFTGWKLLDGNTTE